MSTQYVGTAVFDNTNLWANLGSNGTLIQNLSPPGAFESSYIFRGTNSHSYTFGDYYLGNSNTQYTLNIGAAANQANLTINGNSIASSNISLTTVNTATVRYRPGYIQYGINSANIFNYTFSNVSPLIDYGDFRWISGSNGTIIDDIDFQSVYAVADPTDMSMNPVLMSNLLVASNLTASQFNINNFTISNAITSNSTIVNYADCVPQNTEWSLDFLSSGVASLQVPGALAFTSNNQIDLGGKTENYQNGFTFLTKFYCPGNGTIFQFIKSGNWYTGLTVANNVAYFYANNSNVLAINSTIPITQSSNMAVGGVYSGSNFTLYASDGSNTWSGATTQSNNLQNNITNTNTVVGLFTGNLYAWNWYSNVLPNVSQLTGLMGANRNVAFTNSAGNTGITLANSTRTSRFQESNMGNVSVGSNLAVTQTLSNYGQAYFASNVTINNPGLPKLTLNNDVSTNRHIVLWTQSTNEHGFFGLGINPTILRYQINTTTDNHVWYAGVNSTTSSELMRVTGGGSLIVSSNVTNSNTLSNLGPAYFASNVVINGTQTPLSINANTLNTGIFSYGLLGNSTTSGDVGFAYGQYGVNSWGMLQRAGNSNTNSQSGRIAVIQGLNPGNAGTEVACWKQNGFMGLGTINPATPLEIASNTSYVISGLKCGGFGNFAVTLTNSYPTLGFNVMFSNGQSLSTHTGATNYYSGTIYQNPNNGNISITQSTTAGAAGAVTPAYNTGFTFTPSNYFGINSTNPQYNLDIIGNANLANSVNAAMNISGSNYGLLNLTGSNGANTYLYAYNDGKTYLQGSNDLVINKVAGAFNYIYCKATNGYVGINMTNPNANLDVNGTVNISGALTSPITTYSSNTATWSSNNIASGTAGTYSSNLAVTTSNQLYPLTSNTSNVAYAASNGLASYQNAISANLNTSNVYIANVTPSAIGKSGIFNTVTTCNATSNGIVNYHMITNPTGGVVACDIGFSYTQNGTNSWGMVQRAGVSNSTTPYAGRIALGQNLFPAFAGTEIASWTVDGKMGLNNSNPVAQLDVAGFVDLMMSLSNNANSYVKIGGGSNSIGYIGIAGVNGAHFNNAAAGDFCFKTGSGTTGNNPGRLMLGTGFTSPTITLSNNLMGVNTLTPQSQLDVRGTATTCNLTVNSTSGTPLLLQASNVQNGIFNYGLLGTSTTSGDVGFAYGQYGVNSWGMLQRAGNSAQGSAGRVALLNNLYPGTTSAVELASWQQNGFMGLNTSNPAVPIDIVNNVGYTISGFKYGAPNTTAITLTNSYPTLGFNVLFSNGASLSAHTGATSYYSGNIYQNPNNGFIYIQQSTSAGAAGVTTPAYNTGFVFTPQNYLGINTSTPGCHLDVFGNANVTSNLTSGPIISTAGNTSNGMIEVRYQQSNAGDRYGIQQTPFGTIRMYASGTYGGTTVGLGFTKSNTSNITDGIYCAQVGGAAAPVYSYAPAYTVNTGVFSNLDSMSVASNLYVGGTITGSITSTNSNFANLYVQSNITMSNIVAEKKLVLWDDAPTTSQYTYYGLGLRNNTTAFQVAGNDKQFVFGSSCNAGSNFQNFATLNSSYLFTPAALNCQFTSAGSIGYSNFNLTNLFFRLSPDGRFVQFSGYASYNYANLSSGNFLYFGSNANYTACIPATVKTIFPISIGDGQRRILSAGYSAGRILYTPAFGGAAGTNAVNDQLIFDGLQYAVP